MPLLFEYCYFTSNNPPEVVFSGVSEKVLAGFFRRVAVTEVTEGNTGLPQSQMSDEEYEQLFL